MKILAIETSCDETSVSVVEKTGENLQVLSCVTATSLSLHAQTGGIIPERAARLQVEFMLPTLDAALKKAFPNTHPNPQEYMEEIDAIAVTTGPGLIGSLLVGVETAKTLSSVFNKPLIPVNHVKAHIYAAWLGSNTPTFPLLASVVSGGHTDFVLMSGHNEYELIGTTRDDAAGECFDKCARVIGLPYPGGPSISKEAKLFRKENPDKKLTILPRPMIHEKNFDVSFSGLKTAVINLVKERKAELSVPQLAAEIEEAITDTLVYKIKSIVEQKNIKTVILCGGVSANEHLRETLKEELNKLDPKISFFVPDISYSTDNAAMIASFAFFNQKDEKWIDVSPRPELHF